MNHHLHNQLCIKKLNLIQLHLSIYGKKLSGEGLTSNEKLQKEKIKFKHYLEKEFEISKNYKSELKWFDGAWSRFKPGLGKDKRGVSGVEKIKLLNIGKKYQLFQKTLMLIKLLKRIFELRNQMLLTKDKN